MTGIKAAAHTVLEQIIAEKGPHPKWLEPDAQFAGIKSIPNTAVGKVGEEFAVKLLRLAKYDAHKNDAKTGPWDITANGKFVEVKCASEDVNGSFQFNHLRHDRAYHILMMVGIAPREVFFRFYKRESLPQILTTNMAKKVKGNYKLTLPPERLFTLDHFAVQAVEFFGEPPRVLPPPKTIAEAIRRLSGEPEPPEPPENPSRRTFLTGKKPGGNSP